ncbi:MAG: hypothetical protein NTU53_19380, partial [Planctomycetota bacterium]|nr:hypothetical protein [Planctomycetota bacterium]
AAPAAVLIGSRLFLSDGTFHTSGDWPGDLAASVLQDAHNALSTGHSLTRTYASSAGKQPLLPAVWQCCCRRDCALMRPTIRHS